MNGSIAILKKADRGLKNAFYSSSLSGWRSRGCASAPGDRARSEQR